MKTAIGNYQTQDLGFWLLVNVSYIIYIQHPWFIYLFAHDARLCSDSTANKWRWCSLDGQNRMVTTNAQPFTCPLLALLIYLAQSMLIPKLETNNFQYDSQMIKPMMWALSFAQHTPR
jgi:hypothetical protein